MNKEERKVVPFNKPKEITSPEEYVRRFRDLLVSISEPEHFIKTMELLKKKCRNVYSGCSFKCPLIQ